MAVINNMQRKQYIETIVGIICYIKVQHATMWATLHGVSVTP
jgi:hypothetical protein